MGSRRYWLYGACSDCEALPRHPCVNLVTSRARTPHPLRYCVEVHDGRKPLPLAPRRPGYRYWNAWTPYDDGEL